jgi:hypothetical protein
MSLIAAAYFASLSCSQSSLEVSSEDTRVVTAITVATLLKGLGERDWPAIYVSDEFVPDAVDSLFVQLLSRAGLNVRLARRVDVTDRYDTVRDGGLLLEPFQPVVESSTAVRQSLRFASSSQFGGEVVYSLQHATPGGWSITGAVVVWMI